MPSSAKVDQPKLASPQHSRGNEDTDQFQVFDPTFETRLNLVSQWGGFSLAWSVAVQDGLSYFGNRHALIAFAKKWGNIYVLGDPLGAHSATEKLIDEFLTQYPKACFVQCGKSTARSLEQRGYYINEMGVDSQLDLTTYDFSGKQKEHLRYATNWLTRRDFRVIEDTCDETNRKSAAEISLAWRQTRTVKNREVKFLNRPLNFDEEWRSNSTESDGKQNSWNQKSSSCLSCLTERDPVRRFYLVDPNGKRVALVYFDPIFDLGKVVGYVTSFKRRLPEAPPQAELGISKFAIEKFQSEDIRMLNLGLSPLAEIENLTFKKNPFLHHSFRFLYRSRLFNRFLYPLQGHAEFKNRFRGKTERVHFASRTLVNDLRLLGLLRLCRVI